MEEYLIKIDINKNDQIFIFDNSRGIFLSFEDLVRKTHLRKHKNRFFPEHWVKIFKKRYLVCIKGV